MPDKEQDSINHYFFESKTNLFTPAYPRYDLTIEEWWEGIDELGEAELFEKVKELGFVVGGPANSYDHAARELKWVRVEDDLEIPRRGHETGTKYFKAPNYRLPYDYFLKHDQRRETLTQENLSPVEYHTAVRQRLVEELEKRRSEFEAWERIIAEKIDTEDKAISLYQDRVIETLESALTAPVAPSPSVPTKAPTSPTTYKSKYVIHPNKLSEPLREQRNYLKNCIIRLAKTSSDGVITHAVVYAEVSQYIKLANGTLIKRIKDAFTELIDEGYATITPGRGTIPATYHITNTDVKFHPEHTVGKALETSSRQRQQKSWTPWDDKKFRSFVARKKTVSVEEVAEAMNVVNSTANRHLTMATESGFLIREADPNKSNKYVYTIASDTPDETGPEQDKGPEVRTESPAINELLVRAEEQGCTLDYTTGDRVKITRVGWPTPVFVSRSPAESSVARVHQNLRRDLKHVIGLEA